MEQEKIKKWVATALLQCGAVKVSINPPFTWTSGRKAPIYCDNRFTLAFPLIRQNITLQLAEYIKEKLPQTEVIGGVATAGIPQAALVAQVLNMPLVYVRAASKSHGMLNQIEGKITPGAKLVLIEDLFSTGGSAIKAANAAQESGFDVEAILAIFSYNLTTCSEAFDQAGFKNYALSDFGALLEVINEKQIFNADEFTKLTQWSGNPKAWSQSFEM